METVAGSAYGPNYPEQRSRLSDPAAYSPVEPERNAAMMPRHERRLVETPSGRILARMHDGLIRATAIPYARAGRWQPPQPVEAADRDAAKGWSPACPQLRIPRLEAALPDPFGQLSFDENCLNLSVTAPSGGRDLPVMVWLHGGSYESGAGDMAVFDPAALVREQQVIVVAVTYRLGLLGWLSDGGRPGNLGALDVIAALRWISRNIASFGGDPGNVTLFGQSSGGDMAARLMVADGAEGLFHRVIIQSAPLALPLGRSRMRRAMQRTAGEIATDAPVGAVLARQSAVLRAARRFGLGGQMPFGPEFGLAPFPAEPELKAAHAAVAPRLPVLIGHTRDEAALFLPPPERLLGRLADPARRIVVSALTSRLYGHPARHFAWRHMAAGGQATRFVIEWGGGAFGRAHLSELPLLFPGPDWIGTPLVPEEMDLDELTRTGAALRRIWAGFARNGVTGETLPGLIRFVPQP
ncbi:carboxylesterase family protein [Paracoccus sp. SCSIO 75233]|uniref:carboxylesterase family protein n=1 Tax=Paracoccus sp. SCSIO 75233 TaxID=3017782 RepID=UPI0022F0E220|nr:carboxylesterase family protein [Paracoccus sp. SCSIO 75233]WBU54028.1 carboxylesterase family protein [Paracoccus sp. SCSIO 75233]